MAILYLSTKEYTPICIRWRKFARLYNQQKLNVFCMHAGLSVSRVLVRASFLSRAKTAHSPPESGFSANLIRGASAGGLVGGRPDRLDVGAVGFDAAALEDGRARHQHIGAG